MNSPDTLILVVDDSPFDRTLAGRLLEKAGMTVAFAGDGGEAMNMLESIAPDLILTDLMMPEVDGLELVERVRGHRASIPVVLMTAHGSEGIAVKALRNGAASYVPKRELAAALVATVKSVIRLSQKSHHKSRLGACTERRESCYKLSNDLLMIPVLVEQIEEELDTIVGFDSADRLQVAVALREALVNAIYHGNLEVPSSLREDPNPTYEAEADRRRGMAPYADRHVTFVATHTRGHARYEVEDEGPGFDPSTLVDPTSGPALELAHGRGLVLIRTFMDSVEHSARGNRVVLQKSKKL